MHFVTCDSTDSSATALAGPGSPDSPATALADRCSQPVAAELVAVHRSSPPRLHGRRCAYDARGLLVWSAPRATPPSRPAKTTVDPFAGMAGDTTAGDPARNGEVPGLLRPESTGSVKRQVR
jgi:hypothetical protein